MNPHFRFENVILHLFQDFETMKRWTHFQVGMFLEFEKITLGSARNRPRLDLQNFETFFLVN